MSLYPIEKCKSVPAFPASSAERAAISPGHETGENTMTTTNAYYTTPTENPSEPTYHDVVVTTEQALSSYGQPVVIEGDTVTPAQNFGRALSVRYEDREGWDLVARANALSGIGNAISNADAQASFRKLFGG